jgi:hypothetical protein
VVPNAKNVPVVMRMTTKQVFGALTLFQGLQSSASKTWQLLIAS